MDWNERWPDRCSLKMDPSFPAAAGIELVIRLSIFNHQYTSPCVVDNNPSNSPTTPGHRHKIHQADRICFDTHAGTRSTLRLEQKTETSTALTRVTHKKPMKFSRRDFRSTSPKHRFSPHGSYVVSLSVIYKQTPINGI